MRTLFIAAFVLVYASPSYGQSTVPVQVQSNSANLATQATASSINDAVSDLEANTDGIEGKLDSIITALQLIDDAVYTEDGDITADVSKFLLGGCWYQSTPSPITDGDGGALHCDADGNLKVAGSFTASLVDTGSDPITENTANAMRTVSVDGAGVVIEYADLNEDEDAFTYTTTPVVPVAFVAESTTDTLADGALGAATMTLDRRLNVALIDPCSRIAKTYIPIDIVTAATTEITPSLAGASNHYYVCSINLGPTGGAQNVALVDDDSDGCGSVTSGVAGGTTAGEGWNAAANGGIAFGNGGSSIARTNGTNRVLCLVTSAAQQVSGVITVVAAP